MQVIETRYNKNIEIIPFSYNKENLEDLLEKRLTNEQYLSIKSNVESNDYLYEGIMEDIKHIAVTTLEEEF